MTQDTDVTLIGRSNTTVPKDMTDDEIRSKFKAYNTHQSWRGANCYYQFYSGRGMNDYLGYLHNPTGVMFMLMERRDSTHGDKTLFLNGSESTSNQWPSVHSGSGLANMMSEMDSIDSKRMNWDVVKCNFKSQFQNDYDELYILDSNHQMAKGDLSALFDVVTVLQKGCKTIVTMSEEKTKANIEKVERIKEMIV